MRNMIAHRASMLALASIFFIAAARGAASPNGYDAGRLYNLGNAYARAGQPGLAVLSYERARLLAPNDPDIEINLRRVRESSHVSAEVRSGLDVFRVSNPLMVAGLGIVGLMLAGASGIAWKRKLGRGRLLASAAALGVVCVAWTLCNALLVWPKLHAAVVIAAQVPVKAAPAPLGDALFVLPEAETVEVTAEHDDFVLVKTAQGRAGWIARAALVPIVPRR